MIEAEKNIFSGIFCLISIYGQKKKKMKKKKFKKNRTVAPGVWSSEDAETKTMFLLYILA